MNTKLEFLKSRRFWGLIIIAITKVLGIEGIIPSQVVDGIILIIGGFITIRTIDRASEKLGEEK